MTLRPEKKSPSEEIQALLEKMSAEEIEEFGKWYVSYLKKQTQKEAQTQKQTAHDQAKTNPSFDQKQFDSQQESILRSKLGL